MTLVESELKNAYIGEDYSIWRILNSTLLYYPFEENNTDATGNTTLSNWGSKQTLWYTFSWSSDITYTSSKESIFCSFRIKTNASGSTSSNALIWCTDKWQMGYNQSHWWWYINTVQFHDNNGRYKSWTLLSQWQWTHLAYWYNWTEAYVYKNWVKSIIQSTNNYVTTVTHNLTKGNGGTYNFTIADRILDWVDRENEIVNHFEATKSIYWVS